MQKTTISILREKKMGTTTWEEILNQQLTSTSGSLALKWTKTLCDVEVLLTQVLVHRDQSCCPEYYTYSTKVYSYATNKETNKGNFSALRCRKSTNACRC